MKLKWQIPPCFPPLTYISMAEDFVLVEAAVLVLLPDDVVLPEGRETGKEANLKRITFRFVEP